MRLHNLEDLFAYAQAESVSVCIDGTEVQVRRRAGRPGRKVFNVSSSLHRTASIQWNDPQRARRYSRLAAYAQSQLALTIFAADPRVTAVSVHPGICETDLLPLYDIQGDTAAQGAAHVVRLCDPAIDVINGAYYDRDQRVEPAPAATGDRTVKRLSKLADQLVGQHA